MCVSKPRRMYQKHENHISLCEELQRAMFIPFSVADERTLKDRNGSKSRNLLRQALFDASAETDTRSRLACAAEQLWGDGMLELDILTHMDNKTHDLVSELVVECLADERTAATAANAAAAAVLAAASAEMRKQGRQGKRPIKKPYKL